MDQVFGLAILFVIFLIISFILTRKFWLWYWKVDVRVRLLESIDKKMGAIINQETDLDPEEIRKTIDNPTATDTHDPLHIPSESDIGWTSWVTEISKIIIIPVIMGILMYFVRCRLDFP